MHSVVAAAVVLIYGPPWSAETKIGIARPTANVVVAACLSIRSLGCFRKLAAAATQEPALRVHP